MEESTFRDSGVLADREFSAIADWFPDALLLLRSDGTIVAVNRIAAKQLGLAGRQHDLRLADIVTDSSDTVAQYLRSCSRSRVPLPGSLVWRATEGGTFACRCAAGICRPRSDESEALLLLRIIRTEIGGSQFKLLNERIDQLGKEIVRRVRAEEKTRLAQEELVARHRHESAIAKATLQALRKQLVHQTRLTTIGQMTSSIAHEIRNPLGAVRNAVYYLKNKFRDGDPKLLQYLGIIDQEVNAADRVIHDMLEMARSKEPVKEPFDLPQLVREVFDRSQAEDSVRFHLLCSSDPIIIIADQGQLQQVINNLVSNAVQAMSGKGEVHVELREDQQHHLLFFRDTGPGVDAKDREQLFEPLFTTKAKGTGLGLAICRQIVERHGGTIDLRDHDGSGALFCVRLPRNEKEVGSLNDDLEFSG